MSAKKLAEVLKMKFHSNLVWCGEALIKVWEKQTAVEQEYKITKVQNGVGFSAHDAEFGTKLAEIALAWKANPKGFKSPYGPKMAPWAVKFACRYAGQVARMMIEEKPEAAEKLLANAG